MKRWILGILVFACACGGGSTEVEGGEEADAPVAAETTEEAEPEPEPEVAEPDEPAPDPAEEPTAAPDEAEPAESDEPAEDETDVPAVQPGVVPYERQASYSPDMTAAAQVVLNPGSPGELCVVTGLDTEPQPECLDIEVVGEQLPSWSPDSTRVAIVASDGLALIDSATKESTVLDLGLELSAPLSGLRMAQVWRCRRLTRTGPVFVPVSVDLETSTVTNVPIDDSVEPFFVGGWLDDTRVLMSKQVSDPEDPLTLYIADLESESLTVAVELEPGVLFDSFAISPNGRWLAVSVFTAVDLEQEFLPTRVIDLTTGEATEFPLSESDSFGPGLLGFSGDSLSIYYSSSRGLDDPPVLVEVPLDGSGDPVEWPIDESLSQGGLVTPSGEIWLVDRPGENLVKFERPE